MMISPHGTFQNMLMIGVLSITPLSAEDGTSGDEPTWYDALKTQRNELEPQKLDLLSIQISKLPRGTFGHGKPPWGHGFESSFVAASGTGIYGLFSLEAPGTLKYREALSSLEKFVDDRGKDLRRNPGPEEVNAFDQTKVLFKIRGYSTPTKGAKTLEAEAKVRFLSLSQEKSATQPTNLFETTEKIQIGPVAFVADKSSKQSLFRKGRTRWRGAASGKRAGWALFMDARQKPVKSIELLDINGMTVYTITGLAFDGKSYRQDLGKLDTEPKSVRVTWYEKWELLTVPLQIKTPLGI